MGRMIPLTEMKHVQGKVSVAQYERIRRAARQERMTLQEAVAHAAHRWALEVLGEDPWDHLIGMIKEGPVDASARVDDIYLED